MNRKQQQTLERIREKPTRSDVKYSDVVSLISGLGGSIIEGSGSRVQFRLGEKRLNIHRPHPQKELKRYAVELFREFLGK
ncbi:MAG: type II toxin-antitoxin system HicA family toxin [bacterium]|nr:type II toxin-antitoxin system HicA family toxin [bacterium]